MFKLIPTNHLMSKDEIYKIINKEKPDVIAVELCETRYSLMVTPLLNNLIDERPKDESILGKISEKIKEKANKEGLQYGSDQINACLYAKENNIPLQFVDLDITKTKYLMNLIPDNEKNGFILELQEFGKQTLKENTKDIVKKDFDETELLIEMKKKFPVSFEFLFNMRNLVIINNILKIEKKYPNKKVIVLLGKAHVNCVLNGLECKKDA